MYVYHFLRMYIYIYIKNHGTELGTSTSSLALAKVSGRKPGTRRKGTVENHTGGREPWKTTRGNSDPWKNSTEKQGTVEKLTTGHRGKPRGGKGNRGKPHGESVNRGHDSGAKGIVASDWPVAAKCLSTFKRPWRQSACLRARVCQQRLSTPRAPG